MVAVHHKGTIMHHSTQLSLTQSHSMLHGKGKVASQIIWAKNNEFKWFMFLWLHMYTWLNSLSTFNGPASSSLTLEAQLIVFIDIAIDLAIIWIRLVHAVTIQPQHLPLFMFVVLLPADGFDWSWTNLIFSPSPHSLATSTRSSSLFEKSDMPTTSLLMCHTRWHTY